MSTDNVLHIEELHSFFPSFHDVGFIRITIYLFFFPVTKFLSQFQVFAMPRGMASYVGHLLRQASRPNNFAQKMLKASSEDVSYLLAFLLKKMCYPSSSVHCDNNFRESDDFTTVSRKNNISQKQLRLIQHLLT